MKSAWEATGLERPWDAEAALALAAPITIFDQPRYSHVVPAAETTLVSYLSENYHCETLWSPYVSSAHRRLVKACSHLAQYGRCKIHTTDAEGEPNDLLVDTKWTAAVLEIDRHNHTAVGYSEDAAYLLLLILLDRWPDGVPPVNIVYFSRSGGLRLIWVFASAVEFGEDFEAIVAGLHAAFGGVSEYLSAQGLGKVDTGVKDRFRLWRGARITITDDSGAQQQTFDRPVILLNKTPCDPSSLPSIYSEVVEPDPAISALMRLRRLVNPDNIVRRAQKYLDKMPCEVGHRFDAALVLVRGFCVDADRALSMLMDWSKSHGERWSESEWKRKIANAARMTSVPEGYLLNGGRHD